MWCPAVRGLRVHRRGQTAFSPWPGGGFHRSTRDGLFGPSRCARKMILRMGRLKAQAGRQRYIPVSVGRVLAVFF